MRKIFRLAMVLCVLASSSIMAGCGSYLDVANNNKNTSLSVNAYPAHNKKVLVTQEILPLEAKFEIISTLDVDKVGFFDNEKNVYDEMAKQARKLGADAVIGVKTWRHISAWSYNAPAGTGKAVKITDPASVDLSKIKGDWL